METAGEDRARRLDPESLRAFLAAMAADRLAALWLLLATTGLRRSEALGLPWRALDLQGGQLTLGSG